MKIGISGVPPRELMEEFEGRNDVEWFDLDNDYGAPTPDEAFPPGYCAILQRIYSNALMIKPDVILADVGPGKCTGCAFVMESLKKKGFNVKSSMNFDPPSRDPVISTSSLPLVKKFELILDGIFNPEIYERDYPKESNPKFGFWGVPPYDFSILELFPDGTEVLGWTRAVEMGAPWSYEIEEYVPDGMAVVFFVQSFCQRAVLAKELADRTGGLYVEVHRELTTSQREEIEAFLTLRSE